MIMKKSLIVSLIILGIIIVSVGYFVFVQLFNNDESQRTYPQTSNYDYFTISQLKTMNQTSGNFNTEGYVVKVFTCPPCPKGAFCKECMGDNIIISEENKLLGSYSLTDKEIIILTDNPKQFELSKKYKFSIKLLEHSYTGYNSFEMIGYDILS